MRTQVVQCGPSPLSLYVNDMPTSSDHVTLPLIADDTYVTGTSHWLTLLVSCVETTQQARALVTGLEDRHRRFEQHCGAPR